MQYKYIPDSFSEKNIKLKFKSEEEFLACQIKYKNKFEERLCKYVNFAQIEQFIKSQDVEIPIVEDKEYNFYHKYSNIGSDYLFIRNNFHVEKLSQDEINTILSFDNIENDFFNQTISKVLREDGNSTFFGIPMDQTRSNSNSVVFEFAYDQKQCKDIKQLNDIKKIIEFCFHTIDDSMKKNVQSTNSFIIYNAIPDLFYEKRKSQSQLSTLK